MLTFDFYNEERLMIDERKLLFYRKISVSKNVTLRTLMCLPAVFSDHICFSAVNMALDLLQPVYELQLRTCLSNQIKSNLFFSSRKQQHTI